MGQRFRELAAVAATIGAVTLVLAVETRRVNGQAPASTGSVAANASIKTAWGDPDLQGIWTVEQLVPLERPAGVTKEFYTAEEAKKLDAERSQKSVFGNHVRAERGSEADVAGAYDAVFTSQRRTALRTSMVIDPPTGKVPPLTQEAQQRAAAFRDYQRALIQATDVCKKGLVGCTYGAASPRRAEQPPSYPSAGVGPINRADGPEDRGLSERCLAGGLPDFRGGFTGIHRRIVQTPGAVVVFYDTGQGQGFTRVIPITDRPHVPSNIRQWWGDSRARWDGATLVVDVTNFTPKSDFQGSRDNLHLVERWSRTGPKTLAMVTTVEDPTVWTKPWTAITEFDLQDNAANRIYTEPRCYEGNYGLPALLAGARAVERAFAEGSGPDPATLCVGGCGGPSAEDRDPLQ
jgi:hypothetical protein